MIMKNGSSNCEVMIDMIDRDLNKNVVYYKM
nr:MAG TPA: hypothetical protein [Bacteriophage sp.]